MRFILAFLLSSFIAQSCSAWSEGGHHLIAVFAYNHLSPDDQKTFIALLQLHPRFEEDFKIPPDHKDAEEKARWLAGRAGYWPIVAKGTHYDRPNWRNQPGASLVIGQPTDKVPEVIGKLPDKTSLETQELQMAQAIALCRIILSDKAQPDADRAVALCWLLHLGADAHQPCNSGSLYSEFAFPEGDRSATLIPTAQGNNLHDFWDGLLGLAYDAGENRRRRRAFVADHGKLIEKLFIASLKPGAGDPEKWLAESAEISRTSVYTPEVLQAINAVDRKPVGKLEQVNLTAKYLKDADDVATKRAIFAGVRLASTIHQSLFDAQ